jgi:sugar/nucleoside kinase (ribokinase family)
MTHIDYLAIGHVSKDLTPDGYKLGGTVSFAARVAQALGCRTAVLTRSSDDFPQPLFPADITTCVIPSFHTTLFENVYTTQGRVQTLHAVADPIQASHVPVAWQRPAIVHLGPIANEIDADVIGLFDHSLIGLTPQGWMRRWDENGRVYAGHWPNAPEVLPQATAVILSREDLRDEAMLAEYRALARLLVVTQGYDGCTIYFAGEERRIPTRQAREVDATGAGDIFATAFLVRLHQTGGNPWEAGRFANEIAAISVEWDDVTAKVTAIQKYLAHRIASSE